MPPTAPVMVGVMMVMVVIVMINIGGGEPNSAWQFPVHHTDGHLSYQDATQQHHGYRQGVRPRPRPPPPGLYHTPIGKQLKGEGTAEPTWSSAMGKRAPSGWQRPMMLSVGGTPGANISL